MPSKSRPKRSQVVHSWGILLGMAGIPVLALLSKVFPGLDVLWAVLLAIFALTVARSMIGYLSAGRRSRSESSQQGAASQSR